MKTYRSENLASGDVTTWLYDEATGLMTNKVYADGKGPTYDINGSQWTSLINDKYSDSLSWGQFIYWNSALEDTARNGFLRIQSGGFYLNYSNDQNALEDNILGFWGTGDGGDRGWTGGGALGVVLNGDLSGEIAFDDFTGIATETHDWETGIPNKQLPSSYDLNQAQWTFSVYDSFGHDSSLTVDAPDWANFQYWIHSTISTPAGRFFYPDDIHYRVRSDFKWGF